MKIAVVDDDEVFLYKMKRALSNVNIADSQIDLYSNIQLLEPLISNYIIFFLDIEMPAINGVELASQIREKSVEAIIIFVTLYDNLVFTTFKVNPFGFIRKTKFDIDFQQTITRLKHLIEKKAKTIKIIFNQTLKELTLYEIEYIFAFKNYLEIHLVNGNLLTIRETLTRFENLANDDAMIKINRSVLVNINHIQTLYCDQLILDNGDKLEIAKAKKGIIKEKYNNYIMDKLL